MSNLRIVILIVGFGMFISFTLLGVASTQGQTRNQAELKTRLEKKLQGAWIKNADWIMDYEQALKRSRQSGKLVFAYFTHCSPSYFNCAKVENSLLSSKEFAKWTSDFILYLHITTELPGRKYESLPSNYRVRSFPSSAFIDNERRLLARNGLFTLKALQTATAKGRNYAKLVTKAKRGNRAAAQQVFLDDLKTRRYGFAKASLTFELLKGEMPKEIRENVQQNLVDLQYRELHEELNANLRGGSHERYHSELLAMNKQFFKAGKIPSGFDGLPMLMRLLEAAKQDQDIELFKDVYTHYEKWMVKMLAPNMRAPHKRPASKAQTETTKPVPQNRGVAVPVAKALKTAADNLLSWQEHYKPQLKFGKEQIKLPVRSGSNRNQNKRGSTNSAKLDQPREWPYELAAPGGYISMPMRIGSTAIVCMALVQSPGYSDNRKYQAAVKRATEFMLKEFEHNPELGKKRSGTQVWAHMYGLEFLLLGLRKEIFADEDQVRIKKMVHHLIECLNSTAHGWPAGGWNYTGIEPCKPFMTGAALLILYQAHAQGFKVNADVIKKALDTLETTRTKEGGYAYSGGFLPLEKSAVFKELRHWASLPGSAGRACVSELSLLQAGRSNHRRLRAVIEGFFDHWDELMKRTGTKGHGGPYNIASYYFMFAHRYAAMAIEALPEKDRPEFRRKMQQVLWKTRVDGSWNETKISRNRSYSTAMAMLSLMAPEANPVPQWKPQKKSVQDPAKIR